MGIWSGPFINLSKKAVRIIKQRIYSRVFFFLLLIAAIILAYYMTRPFLPAIITGSIIAYLSYPFYRKTLKYIKNRNFAAFLFSTLIVLLFTVPFMIVVGMVSTEAYYTYTTLNQQNLGSNLVRTACKQEEWLLCKTVKAVSEVLPESEGVKTFESPEAKLDYYLRVTIKRIVEFIIINFSRYVSSIPSFLLNFFIMIFIVYYLLKDGEFVAERLANIVPLDKAGKQRVIQRFHDITFGAFYGNVLVAIIQGVVGAIGFVVFGVPSPILWGFVMMFFALIPYFGTGVIWVPASLNLLFLGYLQNDSYYTINGIALLAYGILIISSIDNFLKPRLIGTKAKVHPVLVLLGVLGGLNLFGFIGLILGPVMLALLMTFIELYEKEKNEIDNHF
ncbi:AI-2E family transporter [Candidatus Woesearchaeota archaeon]|nr:AI-2E family transporter [Candidatus Woesearchaeota archaeon]